MNLLKWSLTKITCRLIGHNTFNVHDPMLRITYQCCRRCHDIFDIERDLK